MKEVADAVWHIDTIPIPYGVNAYLIEDVLIDAGGRRSARKIRRQLGDRKPSALALTHVHADHQGAAHDLCIALGLPYWVPERDARSAEDPVVMKAECYPDTPPARFFIRLWGGPGHPVDRPLYAGDEVAGFRVVAAPGHSPGHVAFWRESDRALILGDVLANIDQLTGIPGLNEPKPYLTPDPAENRRSIKTLAQLEPELVLFGHGRPLRDPAKLKAFADRLPD